MYATVINPGSKFCGMTGQLFLSEESDNTNKPYILELDDHDYDLAIDDSAIVRGRLSLVINGVRASQPMLAEYLQGMANRSETGAVIYEKWLLTDTTVSCTMMRQAKRKHTL